MSHNIKKILFYLLAFYSLLGFVVVPFVLKPQIIKAVAQQTNATIELDSLFFNPFLFKLELFGIHLKDQQNKELFSLPHVFVNVEVYSLFRAAIHIKDFVIEAPRVYLVYDTDKKLNLATLLKENNQTQEGDSSQAKMPRIIVNNFQINNAYVRYEDFTKKEKFDFSFEGLRFELKDLDTKDLDMSKASLRFYSRFGDGGFVNLKSNIIGVDPFIIEGSFDFESSKLYTHYRYFQDILNLEVADGKLSAHAEYFFNMDELNATKIQNATLSLDALRIKPKGKHKDILNIGFLHLNIMEIAPIQKQVLIEKIELDSLKLKVARNTKGEIDWRQYLKVNMPRLDTNQTANAAEKNQTPWSVVLKDIALEKIQADFYDKGISPAVNTKLNNLNLYAQDMTLSGEEPFQYSIDLKLNDTFVCHSSGAIKYAQLDINASVKCDGFDVVHYASYIDAAAKEALEVYNIKLMRATAGFDANIALKTQSEQTFISLNETNLRLSNVALNKRNTGEKLLAFAHFNVNHTAIDLQKREIKIAKTTLANLSIETKMLANGKMNFEGLLEPKKTATQKETAFRVQLKHFALDAAKVNFEDARLSPSATIKADRIFANVYDIDSKTSTWLKYKTYARINSKGIVRANGDLRHTPLKQKGTLDVSDFSLKEFNPYLAQSSYLKIEDGAIDINAKTLYDSSSNKADAKLVGGVKLKEFFLANSRDNTSLLSVGELALHGFELDLMPNRLYISEANLNSFYVDAMIDEKKVMNFTTLRKETPKTQVSKKSEEFTYKIEKLNLNAGSAKFADFSLPIKFQTNIHDVSGTLLSLSSTSSEVAYIDIVGEVDAYGATKLKGSLESSNPKKFTDLNFNFTNLELNAMSGYSAAFAGYAIESGKLYLDLGYKIKDSELLGSNKITINKIKLGEEIKDENTSSLPLGFVIAILEDSEGVIDIDMPVAGNVDAPDFKYGAVVMQTLSNLILKAVASPLTFLGSVIGVESQKLEYISFEAGKSDILPPQREKLDQIVKMFEKRPKISLSLSGVYDVQSDTKALQLQKLVALAIKESGAKSKEEQQNAVDIDVLEDIYEDFKDDDKLDVIRDALEKKYEDDEFKREYLKALIEETRVLLVVSKEELEALAQLRTQKISTYLLEEQKMNPKRVHRVKVSVIDEVQNSSVRMKLAVDVQ
ncbi:MAG TPA: hypothetical protein CFH84_06985 [Sulfurimonas sp. UBA12504]|nr:MAG: hypothetical protein A2019_07130 [Sulfurimonas sp. GWF2_37_8]DAB29938.1 MAG TPA: hypothetical protein CFH84_06985 [Sulfurimonas sp. UBA12504]